MLINDERKEKTASFETIKCGEAFTDEEGDFMMRTEDITENNILVYNVVNLETGDMYILEEDHPVIRLNRVTLTIHD